MNENRKSSSIWQFFTIDVNNNNVAICKTSDYKLSHGNNLKIWGKNCIPVHCPVAVPASYLI